VIVFQVLGFFDERLFKAARRVNDMVWDAGSNVRTECGCMGNLSLEKALPENLLQYQLIITPKDCFKKCTAEKNYE
jgi:hypothetical protein